MLFNSIEFLIFFPIVTFLYFILPHKFRWFMLLAASCIFYMAFIPAYILILALTIVVDYFAGIYIEKSEGERKRLFLILSIVSTTAILFIFKYFNFFNANMASLARLLHWNYSIESLSIILPIGLSFHTFQSLSYVIEVYRGHQKAERNFGIYSLYVMFYPQLVAGPIERPQNLLHQFYKEHKFEYKRVTDGLKLMAWGFFKKVVIADRLAILVNQVYNNPTNYEGVPLIVATIFFAFQIFCDFSGYSHIAIGAAQVMGFNLMENFRRPYFSKSISEFWKRWHISLSTWFKDYLYISMGGNRVPKWRWHFNLFFTFMVSGLWHGSNWTFIIWGALNGFYLVFSLWTDDIRKTITKLSGLSRLPRLHNLLKLGITFSLICFSWIFFRANSLHDAVYIVSHLFKGFENIPNIQALTDSLFKLGLRQYEFFIAVASIIIMELIHIVEQRKGSVRAILSEKPAWFRWTAYYLLVTSILVFGVFGNQEFIYFQF
ncbi:MAG: MBOAT family protein [Clostridia bacterium]|nr:MBOAT family protein [Clostridia bacterium]